MTISDKTANETLILRHKNNLYSSSIFFASSHANRTPVNVSLQQQELPLEITLLLNARE